MHSPVSALGWVLIRLGQSHGMGELPYLGSTHSGAGLRRLL